MAGGVPPGTVAVAAKVGYYRSPLDRSSGLRLGNGRSYYWDWVQVLFPVPAVPAALGTQSCPPFSHLASGCVLDSSCLE